MTILVMRTFFWQHKNKIKRGYIPVDACSGQEGIGEYLTSKLGVEKLS